MLDADKEGYLRSSPSLIQTIGRAARHLDGHVIMYADRITDSMRNAIDETERRRALQTAFNEREGIQPEGIRKAIRDITDSIRELAEPRAAYGVRQDMPKDDLARVVKQLEAEMKQAARQLEFEKAALLRDEMVDLKRLLVAQEVADRGAGGERSPSRRGEPEPVPYERAGGRRRRKR